MVTTTSRMITNVTYEELEVDPYPIYARWRRESPVAYFPPVEGWVVSRWDDCETVGKAGNKVRTYNEWVHDYFGPHLMAALPHDEHQALRFAIDRSLGPKAVRGYIEELARPVSREYVKRIAERGSADATTELLELISVRVIGNVLGMAEVDDQTLQRWFTHMVMGLANLEGDAAAKQLSDQALAELDAFLLEKVEHLTSHPDDSCLSNMIHHDTLDGEPRTFEQLNSTMRMTIAGGFQEPGHGAASSLYGLLTEPEQLRAVTDDLSLIPAAVHEGLRWIAPFGTTNRQALVDLPVGNTVIPAGDEVHLILGSANRDESRYENPDRFDIFRPRLPVASFGYGITFCAGHFVGRELEKIALEETVRGLPNLRFDPVHEVEVSGFDMRGVRHLPVLWDAP